MDTEQDVNGEKLYSIVKFYCDQTFMVIPTVWVHGMNSDTPGKGKVTVHYPLVSNKLFNLLLDECEMPAKYKVLKVIKI